MKTFELKGEIRENFGKSAAKSIRRQGLVPCVIYGGNDEENINFVVKQGDVRNLLYTPEVFLVNLELGDKKMNAILKESQFHPVKDTVMHLDFLHVFDDVPVVIELPVRLEGLAAGVKAGGKLSLDLRKLRVRALASNLPEVLVVNVAKLKIGSSIQVGELNFDGLEILTSKNAVVCRVQVVRAMKIDIDEDEAEEGEETEGAEESSEETAAE